MDGLLVESGIEIVQPTIVVKVCVGFHKRVSQYS